MNRLQFLKLMSTTFAASAFAPQLLASAADTLTESPDVTPDSRQAGLKADVERAVTVVILGAGQRGKVYASYAAEFPACMKVVGVADINPVRRREMAEAHGVEPEYCFGDWSEALAKGRFADAVVISLPDDTHFDPCIRALDLGYDVLLEKPVAPTEAECIAIRDKANAVGAIVGVCHVLRYAPYFVAMKQVIDSGAIGKLMSVQHLEPIQYAHMAHSYVRGNWHNSRRSTPIILAKSCHDLDIIRWMVGQPCRSVAAYGTLSYFTASNRPDGAPARCTDGCPHEAECPYSAIDIYLRKNNHTYVFDQLPAERGTARDEMLLQYLRTTDYGRCVFAMDNDQPDHYVCSLEFEGDITAAFSMEAFMAKGGRRTRVMGTLGQIEGDMKRFTLTDFRSGRTTDWDASTVREVAAYAGHGHGGGDLCLARDFVNAVGHRDASFLTSDINVSVESHLMGFAAERSRLRGTKESV